MYTCWFSHYVPSWAWSHLQLFYYTSSNFHMGFWNCRSHALELYSTLIVIRFCRLSPLWCRLCFLTGFSHWVGERLHLVHLPTLVHHPLTYLTTKTAAGSLCCATTTGGLEWVLLLPITSVEANTHQYFVLSGKGQQDWMAWVLRLTQYSAKHW